jgi:hypothetical protein
MENGQYDIQPQEAVHAKTAFLVVQMPDGSFVAHSDVNTPVILEHEATLNDMYCGAAQVQRDVTIMQTNQHITTNVVNGLMMAMQQQMEAAQAAKIANKLAQKGIHVPGR